MNLAELRIFIILAGIGSLIQMEPVGGQVISVAAPPNNESVIACTPESFSRDSSGDIGHYRSNVAFKSGVDAIPATIGIHSPDARDVVLEYRIYDSILFTRALTGDSVRFIYQYVSRDFWSCLDLFRRKLKTADLRGLTIPAMILYFFLISPVQDFVSGKQRLIIIPDEAFSDIPFEALVRADRSPGATAISVPYLIGEFEVLYAIHTIAPDQQVERVNEAEPDSGIGFNQTFIGFSPGFMGQEGLDPLPASKDELNLIGMLFQKEGWASWLVTEQVSLKEYFKTLARHGTIIHLSTHFIPERTNHGDPGFLFWGYDPFNGSNSESNGILTLNEIREMDLHADLVVLNACAPQTGTVQEPADNPSLAQIFLDAGAKNTVSTLWNINDRVAGTFMVEFYRYLLSGRSISASLREVKLQLISVPETSLPTIWAPYVLTCR